MNRAKHQSPAGLSPQTPRRGRRHSLPRWPPSRTTHPRGPRVAFGREPLDRPHVPPFLFF
jgi:hypothetical protein